MNKLKKNKLKNYFLEVLKASEKNSTCQRLQVAALLIKNNRIVSTGWNGVPSGFKHCNEVFNKKTITKEKHKNFSENYELHAEQNCIAFAAKYGITTEKTEMYVSVAPCVNCAKLIIAAGIKTVYYRDDYDREKKGINLLKKANIKIKKIGEKQ